MAPPQTRYVTTRDGRSIAWSAVGDGPLDVLYVPMGISAMEHMWEHPAPTRFFARIASLGRLILFDRRGSGMSERLEQPASLEEQVDDVRAVMDAAGCERAAVLAMYEGGPMAMLFAASAPERVSSLVLYATYARTTRAEGYEWAWPESERTERMRQYGALWGQDMVADIFAPGHTGDQHLRAWLAKLQRLAFDPVFGLRTALMNATLDVRGILPTIRVPTLVLHRTEDPAMDVRHGRYLGEHIPGARYIELSGTDSLPFLGGTDALIGEIEEFLTGARRDEEETDRILATVLFTDIVKSTERAAALGDRRWRELLERHDEIVRARLERHRGRAVKSIGDGFLATFDGPARGIRAARGIIDDLAGIGVEVRAGLHTGECEVIGDDVGGLAVHIAARVIGQAGPREVLVSSTVKDLVVGSGLEFADRGAHELRGVPGEWRLWEVAA